MLNNGSVSNNSEVKIAGNILPVENQNDSDDSSTVDEKLSEAADKSNDGKKMAQGISLD